jgi:hypothetical protein
MSITITPPVADITIGVTTYTNADWEANTPGTLSAVIGGLTGQVQALGATTGTLVKAISGSVTLTTMEAANINFIFTGALSGIAAITFPAGSYTATIVNNTTGGFALTIKYAAGTTATIPSGGTAQVVGDGTNFKLVSAASRLEALELSPSPALNRDGGGHAVLDTARRRRGDVRQQLRRSLARSA